MAASSRAFTVQSAGRALEHRRRIGGQNEEVELTLVMIVLASDDCIDDAGALGGGSTGRILGFTLKAASTQNHPRNWRPRCVDR